MNIGQIMRGLLGDSTGGEVKAMELKVGQVVRGVVMQSFENNEALVQINGVQVRAKLEMPLSVGQSAILQVQPESTASVVILKAVDPSQTGLLDDTFRDFAKLLSLPDQRWALDIVKDLRREGFLLNRTAAKAFQEAAAVRPAGVDAEPWMTAAAAVFKRGLPMTQATIASMSQVMYGRSAHELLQSLESELKAYVGAQNGAAGLSEAERPALAAATRVVALLEQGEAIRSGGLAAHEPNRPAAGALGGAAAAAGLAHEEAAPVVGKREWPGAAQQATGAAQASAGADGAGARASAAPSQGAGGWLSGLMKWMGVDHELQLAKAATAATAPSPGAPGASGDQLAQEAGGELEQAARQGVARGAGGSSEEGARLASGETRPGPVANEAQRSVNTPSRGDLGAGGQAAAPGASGADASGRAPVAPLQPAQLAMLASQIGGEGLPAAESSPASSPLVSESLKSALMSLASASDAPASLKETAQQLVNHITGQQLLLTPERNSSVFTHVTMFIPFQDANGGTTASVHIQTRRGKRGELDAENCRLLFHLTMSSLGDTLVDVTVTDRIVSLNIWNDHPAITQLIETSRADIADRLQETGYQLSSLRATPLPEGSQGETAAASTVKSKAQSPPDLSQFASTRYKGVDYRA
ncbi:flagellar hook-length control protein FliK [Paenibacillus sp. PL2-23]|uniref:flagellar hook-length control protein FliK n=1 Tax=Paenibacillus sp. PL2-23 TaxID=2100729 RepID=UPI0030FC2B5B